MNNNIRGMILAATTLTVLMGAALPAYASTQAALSHVTAVSAKGPIGPVTKQQCKDGGGRVTLDGVCKGGTHDGRMIKG